MQARCTKPAKLATWRSSRVTMRHRCLASGNGSNINRFNDHKNAASVLPLPVGARISVDSPRAIAGHPRFCGVVASAKMLRNYSATAGWKFESRVGAAICI